MSLQRREASFHFVVWACVCVFVCLCACAQFDARVKVYGPTCSMGESAGDVYPRSMGTHLSKQG